MVCGQFGAIFFNSPATIGSKTGTGGTAGAAYLRRAILEIKFFSELWDVLTDL